MKRAKGGLTSEREELVCTSHENYEEETEEPPSKPWWVRSRARQR
jgi:hypothetical protein